MDETAFPIISMKLQVPPLNISSITVTLYYKDNLGSEDTALKIWVLDITNEQEGDFINVGTFDTKNTLGYFHFNASFSSHHCNHEFMESTTPLLQVTGIFKNLLFAKELSRKLK